MARQSTGRQGGTSGVGGQQAAGGTVPQVLGRQAPRWLLQGRWTTRGRQGRRQGWADPRVGEREQPAQRQRQSSETRGRRRQEQALPIPIPLALPRGAGQGPVVGQAVGPVPLALPRRTAGRQGRRRPPQVEQAGQVAVVRQQVEVEVGVPGEEEVVEALIKRVNEESSKPFVFPRGSEKIICGGESDKPSHVLSLCGYFILI